MYREKPPDFNLPVPNYISKEIRDRDPNNVEEMSLTLNKELHQTLNIEDNIPNLEDEQIDIFYNQLTESIIEAAKELNLPIPIIRLYPSWSLYEKSKKNKKLSKNRKAFVSYGEYEIKLTPKWLEELFFNHGPYSQKIDIKLLIRHETLHLWQMIHQDEYRDRTKKLLEKIKRDKPEIYKEVKELLTSKEMAAKEFEIRTLQKEETKTLKQFLYKSLLLLMMKHEVRKREQRRKKLNINF